KTRSARPKFSLSSLVQTVQLGDDARDVVREPAERAQERDQLLRAHDLPVAEDPAPRDLEGPSAPVREEPGHHSSVDERAREPRVLAAHLEGALELFGLERNVVPEKLAGHALHEVLRADRQRLAPRRNLPDRAGVPGRARRPAFVLDDREVELLEVDAAPSTLEEVPEPLLVTT